MAVSPSVATVVTIGSFQLTIIAYRKLSAAEAAACKSMWLRNNHKKTFPTSGSAEMITTIGLFDE